MAGQHGTVTSQYSDDMLLDVVWIGRACQARHCVYRAQIKIKTIIIIIIIMLRVSLFRCFIFIIRVIIIIIILLCAYIDTAKFQLADKSGRDIRIRRSM